MKWAYFDGEKRVTHRLRELTDPDAVRKAIAKCDQMGRRDFLATYGFGPARTWSVVYDGERYDPKAIASVAYCYQYPDRGPLPPRFSGGEGKTNDALRRLGFEVERYPPPPI